MARNWTDEDRQKQAEIIRKTKPWEKTTGPRTQKGKSVVKNNALKHGLRSKLGQEFFRLLRQQNGFLKRLSEELEND